MSHWAPSTHYRWATKTADAPATPSGSRYSVPYSTLSSGLSIPRTSRCNNTSASRNSRINHGASHPAHIVPSGNHRSRVSNAHPYREARGKSRPSPVPMDSRILPTGQMLFYLRDSAETDRIVDQFREKLKGPLGFDIEYRPNFIKGRPLNKTALVQLASESVVLLVQVSAMSEFPRAVKYILEDLNIVKAGVGIQGDADKLWRDFGISTAGCLELSHLARAVDSQWVSSKGMIGLARLVKAYEDRVMQKPKRIQMSDWELLLTEEQQDYAAEDASAGLNVLQKLYAILPSVEPPPSQARYMFRLSQGRAETLRGKLWPPPPPPSPPNVKVGTTNSAQVSVLTAAQMTNVPP